MAETKTTMEYNIEWDETFQLLSWWHKEKVRNAKVMVVGAGALGNEVLKNLALLNVGNILIVDYDTIEFANLSRSVLFREKDCEGGRLKANVTAERIKEINPNIKVMVINGDISCDVGLGVFRRMDVVIGCLDNRLARRDINRACYRTKKIWVDGAIENLMGKAIAYVPGKSCYECTLSQNDLNVIKYQLGCPDVAKRNLAYGRIPTTPISSSIIAAVQVQEGLKVIHAYDHKLLMDKYFFYEGMNNEIGHYETAPLKSDCQSHYTYDPIIEAKGLSSKSTAAEALAWMKEYLSDPDPTIRLDHHLVFEISPESTGEKISITVPYPHLSDDIVGKYRKETNEQIFVTQEADRIDKNFSHMNLTLAEAGIPPLHILQVRSNGKIHYVELSGDEKYVDFQ